MSRNQPYFAHFFQCSLMRKMKMTTPAKSVRPTARPIDSISAQRETPPPNFKICTHTHAHTHAHTHTIYILSMPLLTWFIGRLNDRVSVTGSMENGDVIKGNIPTRDLPLLIHKHKLGGTK